MNIKIIYNYMIDVDSIIGVSPMFKETMQSGVSIKFSFTLYLKAYDIKISSNDVGVYAQDAERKKLWEELKQAHIEVTELLTKKMRP